MSIWAQTWAYKQRAGGLRPKAILVAVASFADLEGYAFPGITKLAAMTEMSRSSVQRCLQKLIDDKLIRRRPRFDDNGRQLTDGYFLLAPPEELCPPDKLPRRPRASKSAPESRPPADAAGGGCQPDTPPSQNPGEGVSADTGRVSSVTPPGVSTVTPLNEPSEERSSERSKEQSARARATPGEAPVDDPHWSEFWNAYPHPKGDPSKTAHEEWLAIIEAGAEPPQIIQAAKEYARGKPHWQSPRQAVRWLREGCWCDWVKAHEATIALAEPKFASNVSDTDRAWLRDRWSALLREIGANKTIFAAQLVIVEIATEQIRFHAPTAFLRDYAHDHMGLALQRAFGRRIVIDLASPPAKGKVA